MDILTGQTLGKYKLFARLGKGGMARVYKAYQPNLDRYVAVKVMHSHLAEEAEFVSRFEREASAVAHLRHPHIVQVFDFDNEHNTYYMVMEFIEGPTLKTELEERNLRSISFTLPEVTSVITDLASAIDYAHERGMIHRDIKPANVLFTNDGQAVLTDFGIVRMRGTPSYTMTGVIAGTPAYMSPEQAQSAKSDSRSDIYSIGVILYEMVIGQQPFAADNPWEILKKHIETPLAFPTNTNILLTPELETVILKALAKNPDDRYQHGNELARELRTAAKLDTDSLGSVAIETIAVPPQVDDEPFTPVRTLASGTIVCPYQGLYSFNEDKAPFFFGREAFTEQLITAVNTQVMTAVVGPSGSGKSSVVFAGLIPLLRQEERWCISSFRPKDDPFQALAATLLPQLQPDTTTIDQLREINRFAEDIRSKKTELTTIIERILAHNANTNKFLLVIDQFEEIYTLCPDAETRNAFLDILLIAIERQKIQGDPTFNLIITLRTDFLSQALIHRDFADALQKVDIKLGPMTRRELSRAIANPARRQGKLFEKGLVAQILDDVGNEPGNLPLLEFALTELWEKTKHGRLSEVSYQEIGRVEGALARYADKVFNELPPEEQEQAHQIFIQMVRPGSGTEDTRRLATRAELGPDHWQLVQKLANKRLVVTSSNPVGEETVEVVHEALIRGWEQLRTWMNEDRTFRDWQERLRAAMNQWQNIGQDDSALLRGTLLGEAAKWQEERHDFLNREEILYIDRSVQQQEARHQKEELERIEREKAVEMERYARRVTRLAMALGIAIVIASIFAVVSIRNGQRAIASAATAEANAQIAISARETAVFSEQQANEARAAAIADAELRATAEAIALEQQAIAEDSAETARAAQTEAENIAAELEVALNEAETLRQEAEEDERTARSRELANIAELQINSSPSFGLLLALEAYNILSANDHVPSITESVLHNALQTLQLRRVLSRHSDEVTDVAVSPDGSRFATVSLDQDIKIWDTATGQEIQTLERGHGRPINTVAFHPTENKLATGGDDGYVILWNLDTGRSLGVLPQGTNNPVREVTFSPDGSQIAAVTADNLLHLWNATTRRPIEVLEGHEAALTDVAYSPDGRFLATTSDDGAVILREAASNTIIQSINPDFAGEVVSEDEDEEIEFSATAVTFSPVNENNQTSEFVTAAFGNGVILIWQTGSWTELTTLSGHANRINEIAFSPNSQLLGSASNDNTAKVYDVATGQAIFTLSGHTGAISSIAFTPDDNTIITTSKDGTTRLWNDEAGLTPDILTGHRDTIRALDFNANGTRIASGGVGQIVYIWDTGNNEIIDRLIEHTSTINDVAFHPTNENLLATVGNDTRAYLWDLNTGEVLEPPMDHDANVTAVIFNPDGSTLITGSADGLITLWDTETHQRLLTLENESPVRDVAVSADGTLLAVGLENNTAVIWDIQNGSNQIIHTFAEHEGPVNTVTFSPDDQYLATGSEDNTAKIWNVDSGEIVRTLTGHSGPITDVAFHPDSTTNRIATASIDGTMKLWDTEGGLVRNFTGHTGAVNRVVFSPDAQTLATVSADRTIRLNELEPIEDLFTRGLNLAERSLTREECEQYVREGECLIIDN